MITRIPRHRSIEAWTAVIAMVAAAAALAAAQETGMASGRFLLGGYSGHLLVLDEKTEQVIARVPLSTGFPASTRVSRDGARAYALSANRQQFEIVDLVERKSVDAFTLNQQTTRLSIQGFEPDPANRFLYVAGRASARLRDHFSIAAPALYKYDLARHEIVSQAAWGEDFEPPFFVSMRVSPDGTLLYVFLDKVIVYRTSDLTRSGEFDLARPVESGVGPSSMGALDHMVDDGDSLTGLFTIQDAVQKQRRILGVGRFDLARQTVDFFTLGPVPESAWGLEFAIAPDRKHAYLLTQPIDGYEFWTIDMDARRVERRLPFNGRPRMSLRTSADGSIYILGAGNTIDVYDPDGLKFLRTITLDTDVPYGTFHELPRPRGTGPPQ